MPKKLLVADDSVTIHKVIELILSDEDFAITSVNNGKEAISSLKTLTPDIVLADIEMPEVGGFELSKYIKDNKGGIPVILMASAFDTVDEGEIAKCGAKGYIKKPFEAQELLNKLGSALGKPITSSKGSEPPSKAASSKKDKPAPPPTKKDSSVSSIDIDALISETKDNTADATDIGEESNDKQPDILSEVDINDLLSGVETDEDMKIAETSFMEEPIEPNANAEKSGESSEQDDMALWAAALEEQKQVEAKKDTPDADEPVSDITDEELGELLKEPTDTDRIKNAPVLEDIDENLINETALIEDVLVKADISQDANINKTPKLDKQKDLDFTPDTETVGDISSILEQKIDSKRPLKGSETPSKPFVPFGIIPDIQHPNIKGGLEPFLSKADLLNILQYGVNQKISEILSILDNQTILTILKESFKEFIDQGVKETSENFSDIINSAVDNKINEMLNNINLENILNQVISSTIKGIFREFDNNIIQITKGLIEQNISSMLQEKLLPLKTELQGIIWERLPEMAENIIKKEIEMINKD